MDKRCEVCGTSMLTRRSDALTCSARCRQVRARRSRRSPFPESMTSRPRWVRAVGKRPVTASGRPASSTDPATWSAHGDVVASTAGDGMGVMLGDGLACWDLDHCLQDGHLTPDAARIVAGISAPVLFVEVSVSGAGLHVFTSEAESRSEQGRWGGHYTHSRFIRTTGRRFNL